MSRRRTTNSTVITSASTSRRTTLPNNTTTSDVLGSSVNNEHLTILENFVTSEELKKSLEFVKNLNSKINIESNNVTISNVRLGSGIVTCNKGNINTINTDIIDNLRMNQLSLNNINVKKFESEISISKAKAFGANKVRAAKKIKTLKHFRMELIITFKIHLPTTSSL